MTKGRAISDGQRALAVEMWEVIRSPSVIRAVDEKRKDRAAHLEQVRDKLLAGVEVAKSPLYEYAYLTQSVEHLELLSTHPENDIRVTVANNPYTASSTLTKMAMTEPEGYILSYVFTHPNWDPVPELSEAGLENGENIPSEWLELFF